MAARVEPAHAAVGANGAGAFRCCWSLVHLLVDLNNLATFANMASLTTVTQLGQSLRVPLDSKRPKVAPKTLAVAAFVA